MVALRRAPLSHVFAIWRSLSRYVSPLVRERTHHRSIFLRSCFSLLICVSLSACLSACAQAGAAPHPDLSASGQPQGARQYHGKRIDLQFSEIDIRVLLQVLADFAGKQIQISSDVNGIVSAEYAAPWDEVLDLVARRHELNVFVNGNYIYISSRKK